MFMCLFFSRAYDLVAMPLVAIRIAHRYIVCGVDSVQERYGGGPGNSSPSTTEVAATWASYLNNQKRTRATFSGFDKRILPNIKVSLATVVRSTVMNDATSYVAPCVYIFG